MRRGHPLLKAAIAEAVALATSKVSAALARTTDEANRDLVQMGRAVFALVAAGRRADAWSLLDGPEYASLKAVYATGFEVFGRDLKMLAAGLHHQAQRPLPAGSARARPGRRVTHGDRPVVARPCAPAGGAGAHGGGGAHGRPDRPTQPPTALRGAARGVGGA